MKHRLFLISEKIGKTDKIIIVIILDYMYRLEKVFMIRRLTILLFGIIIFSGCANNSNILPVEDNRINEASLVFDNKDEVSPEVYDNQMDQKDLDLYGEGAEIINGESAENISGDNGDFVDSNEWKNIVIDESDDEFYNTKTDGENPVINAYKDFISDKEGYYYIWNSTKSEMPVLILTSRCFDMWNYIDEDASLYGESSMGSLYIADKDSEYEIVNIGTIGESSSSLTALKCDENGIYTKTNHGAYCFMPDFEKKSLEVISGAEDDIVNDYFEHAKGIDIANGVAREVNNPDLDSAYEAYEHALRMRFMSTSLTRKKHCGNPSSFMISDKNMTADEIAMKYAVSLVGHIDYGNNSLFEGDIGDIVPEYKDIDLDGDGRFDTINKVVEEKDGTPQNYYIIDFYYGRKLEIRNEMDGFSAAPNEGEVFEFYDIDNDGSDEILATHYTIGTGGSTAWNTAMYTSNEFGEWKMIPIIGERWFDQSLRSLCETVNNNGKYINDYWIRKANLTESGVNFVVDYGWNNDSEDIEALRDYSLSFNPEKRCLN